MTKILPPPHFGQQGSEVPKPQSPPIPSQPKHKAVDDFSL
jgi:hypothetical protein